MLLISNLRDVRSLVIAVRCTFFWLVYAVFYDIFDCFGLVDQIIIIHVLLDSVASEAPPAAILNAKLIGGAYWEYVIICIRPNQHIMCLQKL